MERAGKRRKGPRIISKHEQHKINSGKRLQQRIINTTLRGITELKVLIHRSVFSGLYGSEKLERAMGNQEIKWIPNKTRAFSSYSYKANIQLEQGEVDIFSLRKTFGPSCIIATADSTYDMLHYLRKSLPNLKIYSLEYAIDHYCKNPEAVADIFYLLRRYLYRRNAKLTSMVGGKFFGWQDWLKDLRESNAVYYIQMGKKSGKHIKVYERGPDSKKLSGTKEWRHEDVDRVRIEFKLKRLAITKKYGLSTLKQLLMAPKFADIASEYVQFKNFKFSSELPQDWDDYLSEDGQGNLESFMQEVLSAKDKDKVKNVIQYVEDNQRMQVLKKRIIEAAEAFDKHWGRGSYRIVK